MSNKSSRRQSRSLAFQVLYSQEFVSCNSLKDLRQAFLSAPRQNGVEADPEELQGFAWELLSGVWEKLDSLDQTIATYAKNWRLERVGRVELSLLRLAVFEMLYRDDVPRKVAMNEALDLNRQFGEAKSQAFINGVLDAVNKAMDQGQLKAARA